MSKAPYKPLRILSLSGGGCRSISILYLLEEVMKGIARENGTPDEELKPCDYFDLIGGTSGGGVVAIMLGRLKMSISDCITEFERLAEKTFKNGRKRGPRMYKFSSSCLVNAVKEVLRKQEKSEDEALLDPSENDGCRTFITTLSKDHLSESSLPIFLRSYPVPYSQNEPGAGCTIWQAIRATTAAPLVFKPIKIGDHQFIDAALGGFNDPADVTRREAWGIWPNRNIDVFLSLGTGKRTPLGLPSRNPLLYGKNLVKILKNNVTGSESMIASLQETYGPDVFFRFNVDGGLGNIKITDWQRSRFKSLTEDYLQKEETILLMGALAKKIVKDGVTWGIPPQGDREFIQSGLATETDYPYASGQEDGIAFREIQCGLESYSKAKEFFKERCLHKEENRIAEANMAMIKYMMYSRNAKTHILGAMRSLSDDYRRTHNDQAMAEATVLKKTLVEIEIDFPSSPHRSLIDSNKMSGRILSESRGRHINPKPKPEPTEPNELTEALNRDWRRRNIVERVNDER